ncbi:methyl-accepting chemotaxis protein [Rossellomorea marisflavi]|uniref:methyl-accepting chemotaxis protein n=1 Tax=Rossellomorea marisflavi TaxID=189381 RepID=UPI00064EB0F8|nr:methyl-accepting chemotaxis protein [Rossellomorea marisflavi]KML02692.1 hypothetical protein VL06_16710 [Rossellomorea marisflavi]
MKKKKRGLSIRTKLTGVFSTLFILSLAVIFAITSWQTRSKTEDEVIRQSTTVAGEMGDSVELFLGQFEKSLIQYSKSKGLLEYEAFKMTGNKNGKSEEELTQGVQEDFDNYIDLYDEATSIYIASPNKNLFIVPEAELPEGFDPTGRDWFKAAAASQNDVNWSDPYVDTATNQDIITASKAILVDNKLVGVIGVDINLSKLTERISSMELGYGGDAVLIGENGTAIVHPTRRGENLSSFTFIKKMLDSTDESGIIHYTLEGERKVMIYDTIPGTGWKTGAVYSMDNIIGSAKDIERQLLVTGLITLAVLLVAIAIVSRKMTRPLKSLQATVKHVARGDLTKRSDVKAKDETGRLADDFNQMIESISMTLQTVQDAFLNVRQAAEGLSAVSEETHASSEEMASAISSIARTASETASDSERAQSGSESLGESIDHIYEQSYKMSELAIEVGKRNEQGMNQITKLRGAYDTSQQYMDSMQQVILGFGEHVKNIENVMATITDISSQTNLLALNASIEAARAGEHGKGFAVVAEEVRKLADQSVQATESVKRTIKDIQAGSDQAVEEMNLTKDTFDAQLGVLNETHEVFDRNAVVMRKINEEIGHMHEGIEGINGDKDQVFTVIKAMAEAAEETAASCEEMNASTDEQLKAVQSITAAAEQLTDLSQELQAAIDRFKIAQSE